MKFAFSLISAFFFCSSVNAQILELSTSNPQPRLGQSFTVSVNIDTLNQTLFHFLSNNFKISLAKNSSNETPEMSVSLEATKKGRNEIGPLSLEFNGKKFSTNKIAFDVVDSLPAVNKGYWIRKIKVNDTIVLILTEQRIPALTYHNNTGSSINTTIKTNDDDQEAELIWMNADVSNARIDMTGGHSEIQSIYLPSKELTFQYSYWSYKITIIDNKKPVVLRKGDFKNLPDYYKFENVFIN